MVRLLFQAAVLILCTIMMAFPARADAKKFYYQNMKTLHKTGFLLDYLLQPENFMTVCSALYPKSFENISPQNQDAIFKNIFAHTKPIRLQITQNEKAHTLELINELYLAENPEKAIDYKRFFTVYLSKAKKSRMLIKEDLLPKTPAFLTFLKTGGVLTLESCQKRLKNDRIKDLISFWPKDITALRRELDDLLSSLPVPKEYKTAYRRLLQNESGD